MQYKKLNPNAVAPYKKYPTDAGWDLTAINLTEVEEWDYSYVEYSTGIAIAVPKNHVGLLFPRSSVSQTGLILANCVGVIDFGYTGEIKFRFKHVDNASKYNIGDRIGQIIIMPILLDNLEEVTDLPRSDRNDNGFGSTNIATNAKINLS